MKSAIISLGLMAGLVAADSSPHHGHQHIHKRKELADRDLQINFNVQVDTAYVDQNGKAISADEAKKGLSNGLYIVTGETKPDSAAPAPVLIADPKPDAIFLEQQSTTSVAAPSGTPQPPPPAQYPTEPSPGGDFPSGTIPCSHFPVEYGALPIAWMGLGGWSGIQNVPNYNPGDSMISFIRTAIAGESCVADSYCSYSCAAGYVKTQWPSSQGNTGQSIGGLYCNKQGFLELSRPEFKTLCMQGCGGVTVVSKLSQNVALCRTDYPGTENMVCPTDVQPGATVELANIDTNNYYIWEDKKTTLQYYANMAGVPVEDACLWNCAVNHDSCGNWAPMIIGTGKTGGITYLSIFQNLPMSTAKPNYRVKITGDVTIQCGFDGNSYTGSSDPNGCTTGVGPGGAIITFY